MSLLHLALGPPSSPTEVVSRTRSVPSSAIENSSTSPLVLGRNDMKLILPFRDHEGARLHQEDAGSLGAFGVRFVWSLPSAFIRNTAQYPSRRLMNAIR